MLVSTHPSLLFPTPSDQVRLDGDKIVKELKKRFQEEIQ